MKDKFFLDTNIFVYSFDKSEQEKQKIADDLIQKAFSYNGCISFQVVQEFFNVATTKFITPMNKFECNELLTNVFEPLCEIVSTSDLYRDSLDIQEEFHYSFYDSMIIAAALQANCTRLITEDMQHRQKIHSLIIENPFVGL